MADRGERWLTNRVPATSSVTGVWLVLKVIRGIRVIPVIIGYYGDYGN